MVVTRVDLKRMLAMRGFGESKCSCKGRNREVAEGNYLFQRMRWSQNTSHFIAWPRAPASLTKIDIVSLVHVNNAPISPKLAHEIVGKPLEGTNIVPLILAKSAPAPQTGLSAPLHSAVPIHLHLHPLQSKRDLNGGNIHTYW
jgi:hypothetical protein